MYTFTPMTEEEIQASSVIEAGTYDFEVIKATRKISKKGNPMAELNINVWDKEGKQHTLFDYLVFSSQPLNIKKVKHFCDATGLSKEYERGKLPEEMENLYGKVCLDIQDEQPKEGGGFYPKKNVVVDYIVAAQGTTRAENKKDDFKDDIDLPF